MSRGEGSSWVRGVRGKDGRRFTSGVRRWLCGGRNDRKFPLAVHWELSQREI